MPPKCTKNSIPAKQATPAEESSPSPVTSDYQPRVRLTRIDLHKRPVTLHEDDESRADASSAKRRRNANDTTFGDGSANGEFSASTIPGDLNSSGAMPFTLIAKHLRDAYNGVVAQQDSALAQSAAMHKLTTVLTAERDRRAEVEAELIGARERTAEVEAELRAQQAREVMMKEDITTLQSKLREVAELKQKLQREKMEAASDANNNKDDDDEGGLSFELDKTAFTAKEFAARGVNQEELKGVLGDCEKVLDRSRKMEDEIVRLEKEAREAREECAKTRSFFGKVLAANVMEMKGMEENLKKLREEVRARDLALEKLQTQYEVAKNMVRCGKAERKQQ